MAFFFIAVLSSFLASILGVGGGFVLLPVLVYVMNVPFKDAVFLSLCAVFFLSLLKLFGHRETLKPEIRKLKNYALMGALGAFVATYFILRVESKYLETAFSILLCIVALRLLIQKKNEASTPKLWHQKIAYSLFFFSGSLSGLFGIGGGILNVPILHQLLRYPMRESTILSFFFVFLTSSVALVFQLRGRNEEIQLIPPMVAIYLLAGTFIGFRISKWVKLSNNWIRILFAILLLGVGLSRFVF